MVRTFVLTTALVLTAAAVAPAQVVTNKHESNTNRIRIEAGRRVVNSGAQPIQRHCPHFSFFSPQNQ